MRLWLGIAVVLAGCVSGSVSDEVDGGADARIAPPQCPAQADCSGRACGPDPVCGATCGACGPQFQCSAAGACECAPSCVGRVCGDDGCGGLCGRCAAEEVCLRGQCEARPDNCPEAADCGGRECGLDPVCGERCGGCGPGGVCREGRCQCTPFCEGRACGDDGCGGVCGVCPEGEVCSEGACEAAPAACPETAECGGRACGPDPVCGELCGQCGAGQVCQNGACVCLRDCQDKVCGDDGCGGMCGVCADGLSCTPEGQCLCQPDCDRRVCGPDGCGGACGACPDGEVCTGGACGCVPDCAGRVCGDDRCGGLCGVCARGEDCEGGRCACVPDCDRRVCGDDGCGGSCGGCDAGEVCRDGRCACVPQCAGLACGPDGCGGACGACEDGERCVDGECVCEEMWTQELPGITAGVAAAADGNLFIAGRRGNQAIVASFDGCGRPLQERALPLANAPRPNAISLLIQERDILVGGALGGGVENPRGGFWARLRRSDLQVLWDTSLFGAADRPAAVWSMERDFENDIWMTGVVGSGLESDTWWAIHGDADADGFACGFPANVMRSNGRVARASPDRRVIYLGGFVGQALAVRGYSGACNQLGVNNPCDCPAVYTVNSQPEGSTQTEARDLITHGDMIDAFGLGRVGGNLRAYVARFNAAGQRLQHDTWDPTPQDDAYLTAHRLADGSYLVGGTRGFDGTDFSSGEAILARLTPQLARNGTALLGPGLVFDIVATGAGDVFVVRTGSDRVWIQRCRSNGDCAPAR